MEAKNLDPNSQKQAEQDADPRVDLAIERTELALERTQLAWVRTLLSMIGGGFVIDKALEAIHRARIEAGQALIKNEHFAGMVTASLGTSLMLLVTINYWQRASKLAQMKGYKKSILAPGFLLSIVTILIGILVTYFISMN